MIVVTINTKIIQNNNFCRGICAWEINETKCSEP